MLKSGCLSTDDAARGASSVAPPCAGIRIFHVVIQFLTPRLAALRASDIDSQAKHASPTVSLAFRGRGAGASP